MNKIYDFACCCAYVLGLYGGFGILAHNRNWLFALAVLALAAMAFPFVRERFKDLLDK